MAQRALDLTSARAKLKRAKMHVDALLSDIREGSPNPDRIPLSHKFEEDHGAVVYRVERTVEIKENWGLVCGDAFHNMRSALDHLAWQLAIRKNKGVPFSNKKDIRLVQFPILTDAKDWQPNAYRKFMFVSDIAKIKKFQPFKQRAGAFNPLQALADFDNTDKHREIHLAVYYLGVLDFGRIEPLARDCVPLPGQTFLNVVWAHTTMFVPNAGDEVFRVPVVRTGQILRWTSMPRAADKY